MEIKNKLTVTRGEGEGNKRGKREGSSQGTCTKDAWIKTMVGRTDCGRGGGQGRGEQWGKWGQL